MKSEEYEYSYPREGIEVSDERKGELINEMNDRVRKGFVAHFQILDIVQNDEELDFLYNWLDMKGVEIRGINGSLSGEIDNYIHMPRMGQSFTPDTLDDEEQMRLFEKLNQFTEQEKKDNVPEYAEIRDKLINANIRLAKWVANARKIRKIAIPMEDKYQMAYIGLIKAVDQFKTSFNVRFSSYACRTIYRCILREIVKGSGEIKQSFIINELLETIPEVKDQMLISLGREATNEEIAQILGISAKRVGEIENLQRLIDKDSLERIGDYIKQKETDTLSDGARVRKSDNGYILDGVYMDETDILPVGFRRDDRIMDKTIAKSLQSDIKKSLAKLSERERTVLEVRYGFRGRCMTLEEVSEKFRMFTRKNKANRIKGF